MLAYVAEQGPVSLKDLATSFGCSKATAMRSMRALEQRDWVTRRVADDAYVLASEAGRRLRQRAPGAALVGAASTELTNLAQRIPWPCDVAALLETAITVVDSNRSVVGWPYTKRVLGYQPHLVWSAMGRVALAFCDSAQRTAILETLLRTDDPRIRRELAPAQLLPSLQAIRRSGFARRDVRHPTLDAEAHEPLDAIAVPIMAGTRLLGCLNCVWQSNARENPRAIRSYINALAGAAERVAQRWHGP
ncbi:MAG: MarR family transcriptional regulator [Proteobacteria bacterium]|nr:MarR family transcriptional regulator [Pseudomonadota bacterium]